MKIIDKLEKHINNLSEYDLFMEHNFERVKEDSDYLSQRILKRANSKMGLEIPKTAYEYDSISSLTVSWQSPAKSPGDNNIYGGFKILGILESLANPSHFWDTYNSGNRAWKNNPYPKDEAIYEEFLPKLNYFHKSGHGDDGTYGCFLREEGVYPCPIYFYDSGIWFPLDLSLEAYYDAMIACNAVYYWQYFYVDTDLIVEKLGHYKPIYEQHGAQYATGPCPFLDKYKSGELTTSAEGVLLQMNNIITLFPQIFPDYDVTFFQERYDALRKALN